MANNKVQLADGTTLIDLTKDTVTPQALVAPYTAHAANGEQITGTVDLETIYKRLTYYGTCNSAANDPVKVITIDGIAQLFVGLMIRVLFINSQTYAGVPGINLNNLGSHNIFRDANYAGAYEWRAYEVVDFLYDGNYWRIVNNGHADTTYYGETKLSSALDSTSEVLAATPKAVKLVKDAIPLPSSSIPGADSGDGSSGTSTSYARSDHIHPHLDADTSEFTSIKTTNAKRALAFIGDGIEFKFLCGKLNNTQNYLQIYDANGIDSGYIIFYVSRNIDS